MNDIAVAIRDVSKTYPGGEVPALDAVSLKILRNEFFTLLGPSGCGKTTLLRMVAGFELPDSGVVELEGVDMGATRPNRRPVNTVFQSYALFPHMSVEQNIAFALEMLDQPRDAVRARVAEMMRLVRLDGLAGRKPAQLSGGQQQRVALARALAPAPKVLLLDEPLSALDLKLRKEMQVELKRLQTATGITFVFVTHDQEEALTMSDRIAVMRNGSVMQIGSPRDVYEQPANLFVAEFIGEANFLPAVCTSRDGPGGRFQLTVPNAPNWHLDAADAAGLAVGATAVLMVRPERVTLVQEKPGTPGGEVRAMIYTGSDLNLHLALGTDLSLRCRTSGVAGGMVQAGVRAGVEVAPDAVRVFAA